MKKLLLSISIILMIGIFSACGGSDETSETDSSIDTDEVSSETADSVLDDQIFADSIDELDIGQCAGIVDSEKKKECKIIIENLVLVEQASEDVDKGICDNINNKRYKEYCLSEVEKKIELVEASKTLTEQEGIYYESLMQADETGDMSVCNKIQNNSWKYECQYKAVTSEASSATDASACDQIKDIDWSAHCKKSERWTAE